MVLLLFSAQTALQPKKKIYGPAQQSSQFPTNSTLSLPPPPPLGPISGPVSQPPSPTQPDSLSFLFLVILRRPKVVPLRRLHRPTMEVGQKKEESDSLCQKEEEEDFFSLAPRMFLLLPLTPLCRTVVVATCDIKCQFTRRRGIGKNRMEDVVVQFMKIGYCCVYVFGGLRKKKKRMKNARVIIFLRKNNEGTKLPSVRPPTLQQLIHRWP